MERRGPGGEGQWAGLINLQDDTNLGIIRPGNATAPCSDAGSGKSQVRNPRPPTHPHRGFAATLVAGHSLPPCSAARLRGYAEQRSSWALRAGPPPHPRRRLRRRPASAVFSGAGRAATLNSDPVGPCGPHPPTLVAGFAGDPRPPCSAARLRGYAEQRSGWALRAGPTPHPRRRLRRRPAFAVFSGAATRLR